MPTPPGRAERVDVVVVGAGQAGLAVGHYLRDAGRSFRILEAGESVGAAWRQRWDSLVLFTSRRFDALPGMAFPGDPDGYPTRDEVVSYLESYAATFELPIEFLSPVSSLVHTEDGFVLGVPGGSISAEQVVVATGPFQSPSIPPVSRELSQDVQQMHSVDYRRPDDVARRRCSCCRRREHRLPDREGALGHAHGDACGRLAADAAAAACARPRPLLVADEARTARQEHRFAPRQARPRP